MARAKKTVTYEDRETLRGLLDVAESPQEVHLLQRLVQEAEKDAPPLARGWYLYTTESLETRAVLVDDGGVYHRLGANGATRGYWGSVSNLGGPSRFVLLKEAPSKEEVRSEFAKTKGEALVSIQNVADASCVETAVEKVRRMKGHLNGAGQITETDEPTLWQVAIILHSQWLNAHQKVHEVNKFLKGHLDDLRQRLEGR